MSDERDPRCVHVAADPRAADLVAAWLGEKKFPCEVVPPGDPGADPAAPPGVEVRVLDVDQAAAAREALAGLREELDAARAARERRAARTGTVTVVCEECGAASEWPAADMGSTQDCPKCGAYLDVPDPDEDWAGVDFGAAGGEDEPSPPPEEKP